MESLDAVLERAAGITETVLAPRAAEVDKEGRWPREGLRATAADRHLRDARAAHVMAPTTDILRVWTGRWTLGRPLLAD